jgi:hypothetical protein
MHNFSSVNHSIQAETKLEYLCPNTWIYQAHSQKDHTVEEYLVEDILNSTLRPNKSINFHLQWITLHSQNEQKPHI